LLPYGPAFDGCQLIIYRWNIGVYGVVDLLLCAQVVARSIVEHPDERVSMTATGEYHYPLGLG